MKSNERSSLIPINVLEVVIVIINDCAAMAVVITENITDDPYPVHMNAVDNTSAHSWTIRTYKSSTIGRVLVKFFLPPNELRIEN